MNERYEIRGMLIYAVLEDGTEESMAVMSDWAIETGGAELVRRANALPEVEARLAEAVELLRRVANPNQYGDPTPREFAGLRNDARAFLDKVKA